MGLPNDDLRSSFSNIKTWGKLYLENLKLLSIEKGTVLFGHAALAGVLAVLAVIAFFFISLALVFLLAQVLPLMWSFLIMGGIYIIAGIVAIVFRNALFINPICRFMTRLFLAPPPEYLTRTEEKNYEREKSDYSA